MDDDNKRITVYMPPSMVHVLETGRLDILRDTHLAVDRSALVRAAIELAAADPQWWYDAAIRSRAR